MVEHKIQKAPAKRRVVTHYIPQDDPNKFNRHLERRKPAVDFRFRPSVSNSSLLGRRSRTNAEKLSASTSGSLVPSYQNFVNLVTPDPPTPHDHNMDSGYISGPSSSVPGSRSGTGNTPIGSFYPHGRTDTPPPIVGSIVQNSAASTIPDYRATMGAQIETIFFKKYVSKQFTYDSRDAREKLRPVMRRALDRMEDRPMVDKFYLHINMKANTIRGEHRRERLRKKPGQRAVDLTQASWESNDYMTAR